MNSEFDTPQRESNYSQARQEQKDREYLRSEGRQREYETAARKYNAGRALPENTPPCANCGLTAADMQRARILGRKYNPSYEPECC